MGNCVKDQRKPVKYADILQGELPEDGPVLRHPQCVSLFTSQVGPGLDTMDRAVLGGFLKYSDRRLMGNRRGNEYIWKSFREVKELAFKFGSGLRHLDLCPLEKHDGYTVRFISIFSANREEWNVADLGSLFYQIATVPLYDTLNDDSISFILKQTDLKTIVLSENTLLKINSLKENGKCASLKHVICMDQVSADLIQITENLGLKFYSFSDIIKVGSEFPVQLEESSKPDDLYSICYTSGTTGNPKGVIITHKAMLGTVINTKQSLDLQTGDVFISYLPAAHVFEKMLSGMAYVYGACFGFYSGDPFKLIEDMVILKPTVLCCVPRILNYLLDYINSTILKEPEKRRNLIEEMISEKIRNIRGKGTFSHSFYDFIYFSIFRKQLGGRVRLAMTGAAPISEAVLDRFKALLSVNCLNSYGQTETAGAATISCISDCISGHVGGPGTHLEIKLSDVPEMGYTKYSKDPLGNPTPSGEICFRGPSVLPKYFKNDQITAESFDSNGWLHSGDIGRVQPNGCIYVFDRKKGLLKLSQAEYVSPERVENVYMNSKFVSFVYVHGNSLRDYLVAVIVPDRQSLTEESRKLGIEAQWNDLCENEALVKVVLDDIQSIGIKLGLNLFEHVNRIFLHPDPITPDSGLLTPTFKMKRKELFSFFGSRLESLYDILN